MGKFSFISGALRGLNETSFLFQTVKFYETFLEVENERMCFKKRSSFETAFLSFFSMKK
ncbi:hypothetical protein M139_1825 [Bacteroides fragilis str. S23L24]|nr:hypothetical protein M139_1825 [Bacteroides fragilis str. S23L24]EYE45844.1 hypothetical protein M138_1782 [Bacteroides fragilis str. S23L17]